MKTLKFILSAILLSVILVPVVALGAVNQPTGSIKDFDTLLTKIQTAVWSLFAIIVFVCFAIAGILFLTSGGAPDKIATARSMAIYGVIGIIVGILAYSILAIVSNLIGG